MTYMRLTQAAVWHHNVHVAATLLAPLLAPVLDADWLVGFYHVGNLELRVHLHANNYLYFTTVLRRLVYS